MEIVSVKIISPKNGDIYAGPSQAQVPLQGKVVSSQMPSLYYKWYASLYIPPNNVTAANPGGVALNQAGDNALDFKSPALTVGSHIITFTAKDQPGDTLADLVQVHYAGMTGGPSGTPQPCIIHVLLANLIAPHDGVRLSKSRDSLTLVAEAPWKWNDKDYQAINHIQYRWRLKLDGTPAGQYAADLVPQSDKLNFVPKNNSAPALVRYGPAWPNALIPGSYHLILRVEDRADITKGDEISHTLIIDQ